MRCGKMRNVVTLVLVFCLAASLMGCADGKSGRTKSGPSGVADVLKDRMSETEKSKEPETEDTRGTEAPPEDPDRDPYEEPDVDLTVLSSTMVYAEVLNIVTDPQSYVGKKIKMNGQCAYYLDTESGNEYYSCLIKDATACCSEGIEFVLSSDYKSPDDYPKMGDYITVVGVFDLYQEGEYWYCTLREGRLL